MLCVPDLDAALIQADCVIVATDHSNYQWNEIREKSRLLVDTRRAVANANNHRANGGSL